MHKFISTIMLYLAGLLLLAHGIIPHHHHEISSKVCNFSSTHVEASLLQINSETCSCSHEHSSTGQVCHLSAKTIVKSETNVWFALGANTLEIKTPVCHAAQFAVFFNFDLKSVFIGFKSSRAPPAI